MDTLSLIVTPGGWEHLATWDVAGNLVLRILLAFVALVAGVGKIMDPDGSRQAMGDFGVPAWLVEPASRALPVIELSLGLLVLLDATSQFACVGLALLFLVFSLGIGNLLRQDKAPPCNCFGAVHSEPVSGATLARALVLAGLALVCFHLTLARLTPTLVPAAGVALAYALSGFGVRAGILWRKKRGLLKKLDRLGTGQRLPAITLADGQWLERALPRDRKTLLLITDAGCGPCRSLKAMIAPWLPSVTGELAFLEVKRSGNDESSEEVEGLITHLIGPDEFARFLSPTPGAILVDSRGTILAPPVVGAGEIEALVRLALAET